MFCNKLKPTILKYLIQKIPGLLLMFFQMCLEKYKNLKVQSHIYNLYVTNNYIHINQSYIQNKNNKLFKNRAEIYIINYNNDNCVISSTNTNLLSLKNLTTHKMYIEKTAH